MGRLSKYTYNKNSFSLHKQNFHLISYSGYYKFRFTWLLQFYATITVKGTIYIIEMKRNGFLCQPTGNVVLLLSFSGEMVKNMTIRNTVTDKWIRGFFSTIFQFLSYITVFWIKSSFNFLCASQGLIRVLVSSIADFLKIVIKTGYSIPWIQN